MLPRQWRSVGYPRPGRTAILPPPKVVRCLMLPHHPHFCRPFAAALTLSRGGPPRPPSPGYATVP